jgi:hypothetical protein
VATSSAVAGPRPSDDQVEILALAMLGRVAVGLAPGAPVAHAPAPRLCARRRASSPRRRVRRRGVGEHLPALLRVRAVEPHDDRLLDRHPLERGEDPARDLVAARDPAEDVEEDRLHLRVARDHLERVDDALGVAAAAEVAEVRGLPPTSAITSTLDIVRPAPLPEHPHLTVELHVRDRPWSASVSSGSSAATSRISAISGWR